MAQANLVQKKVQVSLNDVIKYQLITHCFVKDLKLSNNELDCLTLLGIHNNCNMSDFCKLSVEKKIFKTPQTVRNFLTKVEKLGFVGKSTGNKKSVFLLPDINIQTEGNVVLDYKIYHLATKEQ